MATKLTKIIIMYRMLCILTLLLSACAGPNVLSSDVLPQPYQVLEFNSAKSLRLVIIYYVAHGPENMVDSQEAAVLTERVPSWGEDVWPLITNAPASHLLMGGKAWANLGRVTDTMTDAAPDKYLGDNKLPAFWIISVNPPVVAEGKERIGLAEWGFYNGKYLGDSRLARKQDLAAKVYVLFALDQFPLDPGEFSGNEANAWQKSITEKTRRVQLPQPMTVGAVMKHPELWQKGQPAAPGVDAH